MKISVVIPTRNREQHLVKMLSCLNNQILLPAEIIIVDSSDEERIINQELEIPVSVIRSKPSVCIQRNIGVKHSQYDWILLCDDDIELPPDYLLKIADHIKLYPHAGAVSGSVMQVYKHEWVGHYPIVSKMDLLFRFVFCLGIWGKINVHTRNPIIRLIKKYLERKGNHLSKSGWPIITNFSEPYFKTPVYGLGASLVKKDWLQQSPYDESLDPHGLGDHYGVALGFPNEGIHVINSVKAFHQSASENRLRTQEQYYRRVSALIHFSSQHRARNKISPYWLFWSLVGNTAYFIFSLKPSYAWLSIRLLVKILL